MVNFLKEFQIASMPCLTPYAGLGFGFAEVDHDWNVVGVAGTFSDTDTALAAQLIVGADYNLCNNIALFAQYKFIRIDETDYQFNNIPTQAVFNDFYTHNVVAGIRFSF